MKYYGKEKCRILKEIRTRIAAANDIEWVVSECRHQGNCKGTCPRCEAELRQLEEALAHREALGKKVAVVGISAAAFLVMAMIQLKGDVGAYLAPLGDVSYTASLLVLSVFCSVVAYLLVNYGSGLMSVAKMATFGAISTVCSTFAGVVLLKEPVSALVLLGAALIIWGVWQVTRKG